MAVCARCGREILPGEESYTGRAYTIHAGPACPKVETDEEEEQEPS